MSRIDGRIYLGTTPSPHALIGRAKECRSLEELLVAVRDGQSRVLVVRGEAGIGKSALLRHLIEAASGFHVVHASGVESEMELPFAGLHQLFASMLDRLDALPDPQREAASTAFGMTTGPAPDRLLIGLAALNLLSGVSDSGPLLCVVDDAQWFDRESAQTLAFVARRLLADPVGLVFVTREPQMDFAGFPALDVEGLSDGDAQTLLGAVLHVPLDAGVRDRIVVETHGNPLALIEWPRGLTPSELAGGFGMPALMPMSGQIEESFRRRLAELPAPTQQFLTVAAAEPTGDPVTVWRAATALGVGPHDASPAIDAGLVEIGVRMWLRHPLVRSAAYGAAAVADRQAAHRALADATDPDLYPDRRAWHRALGSPGPDEDIAEALEQSADRARARGGIAAAATLLERSVALSLDPTRRTERILAAATAHLDAGSFDVAVRLLSLAETMPLDDMARARIDALRGLHAGSSGDVRDGPALYLRAARRFESVDVNLAQETYLGALAAATIAGTFSRDVDVRDIARAARACPEATRATPREWLLAGLAEATLDGPAAAAPALRRVLETTARNTMKAEEFHWLGYLTAAASTLWDSDALHRLAAMQVAVTRELGALTMLPWGLNIVAHVLTLEGDLDGATSVIAEANQIFEYTVGNVAWATAHLAGWRDDGDAVAVINDQAASARTAGNGLTLKSALWAGACLYNSKGQYEQALAFAIEANRQRWEWGGQNHYHELIEAAARSGETDIAHAQLERLAETLEPRGSHWGIGMHTRSHALLSTGRAAEDRYNEAIDHLQQSAIRPELARAHLLYGEWLRRENRRADARAQLRTAHDMFTAMGIHGFAERTERELLATGETVRKRSAESFDELTSQETNIARLAADGRTNSEIGVQLFISPRTVEYHLHKVFTKLDITSRNQLGRALSATAHA